MGPARLLTASMLRLKALGLNGVDLPLPAWTDDHATFLKWALCPDDHVLDLCQPFSVAKGTKEHVEAFIDHWNKGDDERFQVLLWATPAPTGYVIGWGIDRVFIHTKHPSGPHMVISSWNENQWSINTGAVSWSIVNAFIKLLGMKGAVNDVEPFFEPSRANTMIFEDAPWSNQRLFHHKGVVYRTSKNLNESRKINGGIDENQLPSFYKWLSHRLRDIARTAKEFRAVWMAGRINSQIRDMHISQLFSLWKTIQNYPESQKFPLSMMIHAAHHDASPGVIGRQDIRDRTKRFLAHYDLPEWATVSFTLYWDRKNPEEALFHSTPIQTHLRQTVRTLSLSESFRWVRAVLSLKKIDQSKPHTPPQALLELLLIHARRIPKQSTLSSMLSSPFPFWAWLSFHTSWAKEGNSERWTTNESLRNDCSKNYKKLLLTVEEIRKQQQRNPMHFQTMARAALAWVKSSETENGPQNQNPNEVLAQLQKMTIPDALRKERVNKRLTWQGVLSLKRSVEAVKLSPTKDFIQPAPAQGLVDLGWPTAIGNLRLGRIDVHPLCRPSHLDLMGEFLQNCVQKSQHLKGFIHVAYQGRSRFFRLSDEHREFLLQISHTGNQVWTVTELRGRENHAPTPEAAAVGQRVADLYTLLSAESPTLPHPAPPNPWEASTDARNARALAELEDVCRQNTEDRTNDLDDVVHIIREIIDDLDGTEDVNDLI